MKRCVVITDEPIDPGEFFKEPGRHTSGAAVTFLGIVRHEEQGKKIEGIIYEVYEEMARVQLDQILDETEKKWDIEKVVILHRYGFVPTGEVATLIQVFAEHRGEAFKTARYVIDRLKQLVPIWKHPQFSRTSP